MKLDSRLAALHKKTYERFLDELDTTVVKIIMGDPNSDEAVMLNARVETELLKENTVLVFES